MKKKKISKAQKNMDQLKKLFQKITKDNMNLKIMFQQHDDNIIGSKDNITLFIKDNNTKEHQGINLTYYFELWNNEARMEDE
jgi:hypothetical protein